MTGVTVKSLLGAGSFGEVYLGEWVGTPVRCLFAVTVVVVVVGCCNDKTCQIGCDEEAERRGAIEGV